jgi:hypothetical protein
MIEGGAVPKRNATGTGASVFPRGTFMRNTPLPKCLQNFGGFGKIAVDARELTECRKQQGVKVLEPEVARHQKVKDGRS